MYDDDDDDHDDDGIGSQTIFLSKSGSFDNDLDVSCDEYLVIIWIYYVMYI